MPSRHGPAHFVRRWCNVVLTSVWLTSGCQAPTTPATSSKRAQPALPPVPAPAPAPKPALPTTANERVEAFSDHLAQFFHALPPPEVLETPVACPPNLALSGPTGPLAIVDARLLRFFVAGRPAIVVKDNKVVPEASLDGTVELNSEVFIRLLAVLREQAVKAASTLPHKPNNTPESLVPGIQAIEATDRLLVLVGDAQIAGRDREQKVGGRYTGHLVASVWSTKRGLCFVPISVTVGEGSDPTSIERKLVVKIQQAVNAAAENILPGQAIYTGSPQP